jgi:G3E family GTPase
MSAVYVTIGGFLGAGKTTACLSLAERLIARGLRVGLITNDQSSGLVDTSLVAAQGHPVREITDGCFCCRFESLVEAAESLTRELRPDVLLAEPVGSCTDLRATIQLPLQRLYGDAYRVAALSVLLDPLRAVRAFDLDPGPSFSRRVLYIYEKQLEEAEILVVNKVDLVSPELRGRLESVLAERYPHAEVRSVSARTGLGLESWLDRLLDASAAARPDVAVDYDVYAEGEALLGWLNATVQVGAPRPFDGNRLLERVAGGLQERLAAARVEIAHLKMTLIAAGVEDRSTLNLVRTGGTAELSRRLQRPIAGGELIVNLRAEDDPERLRATLLAALADAADQLEVSATVEREAHFRPGRPVPTHRMVTT